MLELPLSKTWKKERGRNHQVGPLSKTMWGFFSLKWWTVSKILVMTITIHHFQNLLKVK